MNSAQQPARSWNALLLNPHEPTIRIIVQCAGTGRKRFGMIGRCDHRIHGRSRSLFIRRPRPPTPLCLSLNNHTLPLPSASPSPPTPSHSPLPLPHHPHHPTPLCLSLSTHTLPLSSASPSTTTPSHSPLPLPQQPHPPTPLCLSPHLMTCHMTEARKINSRLMFLLRTENGTQSRLQPSHSAVLSSHFALCPVRAELRIWFTNLPPSSPHSPSPLSI
ncbi:hypothetical protein BLNAU_14938 [Blattamonas nauphoetae]|uniref:Uncharacterized protein n=1 Tax=Blattamonas nauphoetae TaxID=2049346 RepID=A0ABQ9XC92_9EUKA|nr:hypothetical protein BLNAU_14938 [Blattamonas nauphoetae]